MVTWLRESGFEGRVHVAGKGDCVIECHIFMGEKSLSLMIKTLSHLSQTLLGMFFSLLNITLPEGHGELLHYYCLPIGEMIFRTSHRRAVVQDLPER